MRWPKIVHEVKRLAFHSIQWHEQAVIDALGVNGWRLVSVLERPLEAKRTSDNVVLWFQREKEMHCPERHYFGQDSDGNDVHESFVSGGPCKHCGLPSGECL